MRARFLIRLCTLLGLPAVTIMPLKAQLAITEIMSSASTNLGSTTVTSRSDFWELTNFGTDPIDLTGYRWNDSTGGLMNADTTPFTGLTIGGGESIIFFESNLTATATPSQFRSCWGLSASVRAVPYNGNGLGSGGDSVLLWGPWALNDSDLVDGVTFGLAQRGSTFTYNRLTGLFDRFSTNGVDGAFKAVETDDVGSPGTNAGPVPILIQQQPQNLEVEAGASATFSVRATGLPPPRFQWLFNGTAIPGAKSNTFHIPAAQPADAGTYSAQIANGVDTVIAPAELVVNPLHSPPRIVVPPADLRVIPGQKAVFTVVVLGYEPPTFQWRFNNVVLPTETNATVSVANANVNSAGTYSVRIQNSLGFTNAAAVLSVLPKPNLVITEIMGGASTNATVPGHAEWWELTNSDTDAVNLRGYRFHNRLQVLEIAVVVTNDVVIQPGESVLFIQDMTPEAFTSWWGEENLPENVQFVRYASNRISFSGSDALYLWNAAALDSTDLITNADYTNVNPDFTKLRGNGLSYWCNGWIEFGHPNVPGQCGAIRAEESDDIGSPGYIANHPPRTLAPRCLSLSRDAQGTHLTWKTQNAKRYELQSKSDLEAPTWTPLSQHTTSGTVLSTPDPSTDLGRRFYRLQLLPDSP